MDHLFPPLITGVLLHYHCMDFLCHLNTPINNKPIHSSWSLVWTLEQGTCALLEPSAPKSQARHKIRTLQTQPKHVNGKKFVPWRTKIPRRGAVPWKQDQSRLNFKINWCQYRITAVSSQSLNPADSTQQMQHGEFVQSQETRCPLQTIRSPPLPTVALPYESGGDASLHLLNPANLGITYQLLLTWAGSAIYSILMP
jgi:hypothetical protein